MEEPAELAAQHHTRERLVPAVRKMAVGRPARCGQRGRVLRAQLHQCRLLAHQHSRSGLLVLAHPERCRRVVAGEVEEPQRFAIDQVATLLLGEQALIEVPVRNVVGGAANDVRVEDRNCEVDPSLIGEQLLRGVDERPAAQPGGPPLQELAGAAGDADEAEVVDARSHDGGFAGFGAVVRDGGEAVWGERDARLHGCVDQWVEPFVDLDVGVDVEGALGRPQQVLQCERLHRRGELGHVVDGRHVLETLVAEVELGDGNDGERLVDEAASFQRMVDHDDRERGLRVPLQERSRQHPGHRKVVVGDDGARRERRPGGR